MKIISLNTWGGRAGKEELTSFFKKYREGTDIFCLQEIWSAPHNRNFDGQFAGGHVLKHSQIMTDGMQNISKSLSDHVSYFRPHLWDNYGLMMSVGKDLKVIKEGELFVFREKGHVPEGDLGNHARNIQFVTLMIGEKLVTVINFHGLWNGKGKTDTEDRINQSQNIINFIKSLEGECILCGDFNLLPDTKSIKLFESFGLVNLIKEYNMKSTRTSFYTKPEKYADYVFVSKGVEVNDFKVLPDEVSDHLAMYLDFE
ncbi:MAG: endonuclease/exonuclease/phosphatase family protein [Candidatus Paceibacterota bacterium]|jgi:endonuclease/exonuclease/phosphatase family metal-dependent hydrolase